MTIDALTVQPQSQIRALTGRFILICPGRHIAFSRVEVDHGQEGVPALAPLAYPHTKTQNRQT